MVQYIVTTVKSKPHLNGKAREIAASLNCLFAERGEHTLEFFKDEFASAILIIVGDTRIVARVGNSELFFHPSMSLLRLMNHAKGQVDRMAEAMALKPGMHVLDCTLGFASDALVASYLTGPTGSVTGVEASPLAALLVRMGVNEYTVRVHDGLERHKAQVLAALPGAMQRIKVINMHHLDFLLAAKSKSFDIVYFDPMFRKPRTESASMAPLRGLALPDPISVSSVQAAMRVARRRVVLKEGRFSTEFARLGFSLIPGGKYSEVAYGIIEV
ncbi:MAG: class I SAM-dependent methyltransferase [Peptococcaceae bacterium]|nr:class I SAM-dependent methyltransferase [Peptococcaceae bacterium]